MLRVFQSFKKYRRISEHVYDHFSESLLAVYQSFLSTSRFCETETASLFSPPPIIQALRTVLEDCITLDYIVLRSIFASAMQKSQRNQNVSKVASPSIPGFEDQVILELFLNIFLFSLSFSLALCRDDGTDRGAGPAAKFRGPHRHNKQGINPVTDDEARAATRSRN